jgi:hypothetical protein
MSVALIARPSFSVEIRLSRGPTSGAAPVAAREFDLSFNSVAW